jgi:hypothetical protein
MVLYILTFTYKTSGGMTEDSEPKVELSCIP